MAPRSTRAVASCLLLLGLATADSFALLQQQQQQQQRQRQQTALPRATGVCAASSFLKPLPGSTAHSSSSSSLIGTAHATAACAAGDEERAALSTQALLKASAVGGLLSKRRGGAAAAAAAGGEKSLWEKTRVWVFIGLWYFFNVAFNIYNKKVCAGYGRHRGVACDKRTIPD